MIFMGVSGYLNVSDQLKVIKWERISLIHIDEALIHLIQAIRIIIFSLYIIYNIDSALSIVHCLYIEIRYCILDANDYN